MKMRAHKHQARLVAWRNIRRATDLLRSMSAITLAAKEKA